MKLLNITQAQKYHSIYTLHSHSPLYPSLSLSLSVCLSVSLSLHLCCFHLAVSNSLSN